LLILVNSGHHKKPSIIVKYEDQSTSNAISHMMSIHRISKDGPIPRRSLVSHARDSQSSIQATFKPSHFRRMLRKWIIEDNIHFSQVDSPRFRELMEYTNREFSTSTRWIQLIISSRR